MENIKSIISYDQDKLISELKRDEGVKAYPNRCSEGYLTIGVGFNLDANSLPKSIVNDLLIMHGLTEKLIKELLDVSINTAINEVAKLFPKWRQVSAARQRVLINMALNLGYDKYKEFVKFWAAMGIRDYPEATKQMLDSVWAGQVGVRADRLADMMERGSVE